MQRLRNESEGTSLVLFMLCLLVLLGFAAIAIDGAAAWAQRRENQAAADTGAIAGAIFISGPAPTAIAAATSEVIRITYETVDPDMSFAAWSAAWTSCTDPTRPAEYTLTGTSPCISFTANLAQIRVRMPNVDVPTTFGRILGRDFIATSAIAEVGTEAADVGVLPFGLPWSVNADTEVCLKSGANPKNVAPCDGPDSGNFGFLDITLFGPPAQCTGNTTNRLARNIMVGTDHALAVADEPDAVPLVDRDVCTSGDHSLEPYTLTTETGNMAGVVHDGLAVGDPGEGIPGRLSRGDNTIEIAGVDIDDTPLRHYLTGHGQGVCSTPASNAEMIACLDSWDETDGPLFDSSLTEAVRFAWVPIFWEDDLGNGNSDRTIREFRPVYLQTTMWKCKSNSCKYIHDPGDGVQTGSGGGGSTKIEALSAIQIPLQALHVDSQAIEPGTGGEKEYLLLK